MKLRVINGGGHKYGPARPSAARGSTLVLGKPRKLPLAMVCYMASTHNDEQLAAVAARSRARRRLAWSVVLVAGSVAVATLSVYGG